MILSKKVMTLAVSVCLAGALAVSARSAGWLEQITVRKGIRLNLNGEEVVPVDASGKEMPIFLYQNTTYVPVRFLSEQFGKEVEWDGPNAAVYISDPAMSSPDQTDHNPDSSIPEREIALKNLLEPSILPAGTTLQPDGNIVIRPESKEIKLVVNREYRRIHFKIRALENLGAGRDGELLLRLSNGRATSTRNIAFRNSDIDVDVSLDEYSEVSLSVSCSRDVLISDAYVTR